MYYVIVSLVNIGVLQATLDSALSDFGEVRYKVLRDTITFIFGFFFTLLIIGAKRTVLT